LLAPTSLSVSTSPDNSWRWLTFGALSVRF
jgi:hypothetical protein